MEAEDAYYGCATSPNGIATLVLAKFEGLPSKNKPIKDSNGVAGWVPLSGIVLTTGKLDYRVESLESMFSQVQEKACLNASRWRMKCLPASKVLLGQGRVLHDSHAEILAVRTFNHFLIQECRRVALDKSRSSPYVVRREEDIAASGQGQPFSLKPGVKIHMYCSEAPCGDTSMELTMRAQVDATPWPVGSEAGSDCPSDSTLNGRGYFSELGIVRRKPARGDSPLSLSKSCSDKLALKQCTSLLSSTVSTIISPENVYLSTLIIPQSEYVEAAFARSFSPHGRMRPLVDSKWPAAFSYHPFQAETTSLEFQYSRRLLAVSIAKPRSSNICAVWNPYMQETLINGMLQGWKQSNPKCASSMSRLRMATDIFALLAHLDRSRSETLAKLRTYRDFKRSDYVKDYKAVKKECTSKGLVGWLPNEEDSFIVPA